MEEVLVHTAGFLKGTVGPLEPKLLPAHSLLMPTKYAPTKQQGRQSILGRPSRWAQEGGRVNQDGRVLQGAGDAGVACLQQKGLSAHTRCTNLAPVESATAGTEEGTKYIDRRAAVQRHAIRFRGVPTVSLVGTCEEARPAARDPNQPEYY